ncbi:MAG: GGDEF domain-containing protein [Coriobacteriia bacterium]|nr:GGDEF domain-containing protein [Coriobacteriia bacterium]
MLKTDAGAMPRDGAGGIVSVWGDRLMSSSLTVRTLFCAALLVLVAALDTSTGSEISFSIFYLVPVSFAGAYISRRAGVILAVASAAVWGYLEFTTGRGYSAAWIPYWNTAVRLGFFLLVNELIERLRRAHATQRALAREDSLTGIANARVFEEYAQRTLLASRRNGRPFTLAYVDLDRFKHVNDEFGHSEGDKLLRVVATLIADGVRSTDVVARLGGDEFGILMPDTEAEPARMTLDRIAVALHDAVGTRWAVGATVGAVTFTRSPKDVDSAVHQADELMYRGKAQGRGRIIHETWPAEIDGSSSS